MEECKNLVLNFFAQIPQNFYRDGTMMLLKEWQKVTDRNGTYLVYFQNICFNF